jgi:hypothetical protein
MKTGRQMLSVFIYFSANGHEREQYAHPLDQREPVTGVSRRRGSAELAREPRE